MYIYIYIYIREKAWRQQHKNAGRNIEQIIPQSSSCTATYHPSRKLLNLDEPDMRDTAGEVGTNSEVTYSCGPSHMNEWRQEDQLEPTYNISVPIQDVALKTPPEAMDDREEWQESVREIHVDGVTWWW